MKTVEELHHEITLLVNQLGQQIAKEMPDNEDADIGHSEVEKALWELQFSWEEDED